MPRVKKQRDTLPPAPSPTPTTRTKDVVTTFKFTDLNLSSTILRGIRDLGFVHPSPVQVRAIPPARFGADVVVQSKAGTGKTLVFTVALLENLIVSDAGGLQAIVLAPTREIAHQICNVIRSVGAYVVGESNQDVIDAAVPATATATATATTTTSYVATLQCHCFIGGLPLRDDLNLLRTTVCHVAVGTPGRVRQLVGKNALDTKRASMLILDEADKMLGDGSQNSFAADILAIASSFPPRKQVMAFSATYPKNLAKRIASIMRDAVIVRECVDDVNERGTNATTDSKSDGGVDGNGEVDGDGDGDGGNSSMSNTPSLLGVAQYYSRLLHPSKSNSKKNSRSVYDTFVLKLELVRDILLTNPFNQCIIFCNHRGHALTMTKKLQSKGWPAAFIAGDLPQRERLRVFDMLMNVSIRVLISTDLTARGIDCETVDLVINMDLPSEPETYLHRVGRTGRFGSVGSAITLIDHDEMDAVNALARMYSVVISELRRNKDNGKAADGIDGIKGGNGMTMYPNEQREKQRKAWEMNSNKKEQTKAKKKQESDLQIMNNDPLIAIDEPETKLLNQEEDILPPLAFQCDAIDIVDTDTVDIVDTVENDQQQDFFNHLKPGDKVVIAAFDEVPEHIFQIRTIEEDCITGMALTGSLKGEYGEPDMKMIARVCSNKDLSSLKIVRDTDTSVESTIKKTEPIEMKRPQHTDAYANWEEHVYDSWIKKYVK